jgi:hypothetical protein
MKLGLLRGVDGDCIGLATGRLKDDFAGVAVAEWADGGGESIEERPSGLRTGIDDWPETLRKGVSPPLRYGEDAVEETGL